MRVALSMLLALGMVLFGAELFTNAVEWLGRKLGLGQGAVGSVLAALGTALPETAVPVTAILFGGGTENAREVGIGGILGAPFLLATLGSLIMALALLFTRRLDGAPKLTVGEREFQRDMRYFLVAYALVLLTGCLNVAWLHHIAPFLLVGIYVQFVVFTLRDKPPEMDATPLHALYLQWKADVPSTPLIILQLAVALCSIVGGAQLLASGVQQLAGWVGIPTFVLSVLLIPLTTELPETLNSVVWIRQGKDALAVGNITGAMVFQSTLVPALGIWLTPWNLTSEALLTGGLTLAAAALIFGMYRLQGALYPPVLLAASVLYWLLPVQVLAVRYDMKQLYWVGGVVVGLALSLVLRRGLRYRSV